MFSFDEWDPEIAKKVAYEEGHEDGFKEGCIETTKQLTTQFVLSLLKNKAPIKLITESTNLSAEEVEKIAKEHQLAV